jgi:nucleolar protein 53
VSVSLWLTGRSIPEAPLEVVLPDELRDSLRLLKPEGNLLKDRFRSMMIRGKVESRRQIPYAKQKKYTVSEKWSYKDWQLPAAK